LEDVSVGQDQEVGLRGGTGGGGRGFDLKEGREGGREGCREWEEGVVEVNYWKGGREGGRE
jgi:hypothetical protein